jgi:hypothetical protein
LPAASRISGEKKRLSIDSMSIPAASAAAASSSVVT